MIEGANSDLRTRPSAAISIRTETVSLGCRGRRLTRDDPCGVPHTADTDAAAASARPDDARVAAHAAGPRVVYCGGCNPHIDRGAVADEVTAAPTFVRPGGVLYLSGCSRACASDHRLLSDDPASAVVAGSTVDGVPVPAAQIAAAVRQKLKE